MKPIILIISMIISCSSIYTYAQTREWIWANKSISSGSETGRDVATDIYGNVYVCGTFTHSTTFGSINITKTNGTNSDVFLVKYDNAGNVVWVRTAGSNNDDSGWSLIIDSSQNIIVVGTFSGGSISFGLSTLMSLNGNMFAVKYDSSGNVLWANNYGKGVGLNLGSMSKDAADNIFITGSLTQSGGANFGGIILTNLDSYADGFVVKINSNGTVVWARQFTSTGGQPGSGNLRGAGGQGTAVDQSGNCYVLGAFIYGEMFGMPFNLEEDGCILKYDNNGNLIWARSQNGSGGTLANGVERAQNAVIDDSGNVYVCGWFCSQTVNIGGIILTNTNGAGLGHDAWVAKYNSSGTAIWAKNYGGSGIDLGLSIKLDAANNVWLETNSTSPSITFDSFNFTSTGGGSNYDIYLTKHSSITGNVLQAFHYGGSGNDVSYDFAIDNNDQIYMTGFFSTPTFNLGSLALANSGSTDFFVGKFAPWATLNCKIIIEGYYIGEGLMQPVLFNTNQSTDTNVCDFLIIELCNQFTNMVERTDSVILTTNGISTVTYPPSYLGKTYYITIRNRAAIETWSKLPITLSSNTILDFTGQ